MAKRYYICEVIGTGTGDDGFRAAVAEFRVTYAAVIPTDDRGQPIRLSVLALVDSADHEPLSKDARIQPLPDSQLDGKVEDMPTDVRTEMQADVEAKGFTVDWLPADDYRDVIRSIGKQLDPAFHEANLNVAAE